MLDEHRKMNVRNQVSWLESDIVDNIIQNEKTVAELRMTYGNFPIIYKDTGDIKYFVTCNSTKIPLCYIELTKEDNNLWSIYRIERNKNVETNHMASALLHYIVIDMNLNLLSHTLVNDAGEKFFRALADRQQMNCKIYDCVTKKSYHMGEYKLDDGTFLLYPENDKAQYDILSLDLPIQRRYRETPEFRFRYLFSKDSKLAESYYWNEQLIKNQSQKEWFIFGEGLENED